MKRLTFKLLLILLILTMAYGGVDQFKKLRDKLTKKIPGISKILKSKPSLTTSLTDAVTEVPFLDDYNPEVFTSMDFLPRTPEGSIILKYSGRYMYECESYCLRAGTYAPGEGRGGDGYLYAPLKGPHADIIRNILKKSYLNPGIPQEDIQVLLWAIISRTKVKDMSRNMQLTAARLLTPKEIYRINGSALGLIPKGLLEKAFENLPEPARQVMEAEARIREMLTKTHASYEELEEVAVLHGDPPHQEGDRKVPLGRWCFHPDGYFIRYFPDGYKRMHIELYAPESFRIKRDSKERIISITDQYGNSIKTEYDDATEPLSVQGESSLKGYAFQSIRFEHFNPDIAEEKQQIELTDVGWTFLGEYSGEGQTDMTSGRFSDCGERYERCQIHKEELDNLYYGLKKLSGGSSPPQMSQKNTKEIMDLAHYCIALKEAINNHPSANENWIGLHIDLAKEAWQSAVSRSMGTHPEELVFDPADDPVPGKASSQRLADSGRKPCKNPEAYYGCCAAAKSALEDCIRKAELDAVKDMHFKEPNCNIDCLIDCIIMRKMPENAVPPLLPGPPGPDDCALMCCKNLEKIPEKDMDDILKRLAEALNDCMNKYKSDVDECAKDNCK